MNKKHVVIVGGGFAGMACAHELAKHPKGVHITLIDKNNYNQFKPLLYQVATSALATEDVATVFRDFFKGNSSIDIKMEEADTVDPAKLLVKTKEGNSYQGDYLVLAAGSIVNFFGTQGAEENTFPLYTLKDAENLRSEVLAAFEKSDVDPSLVDKGALNFLIIGGGPTGVEVAGALADMLQQILPQEYADLPVEKAQIHLVDGGHAVLKAFTEESQKYAAKVLTTRGVQLNLGVRVSEVGADHVVLSDGSKIPTRTVIWAGGLKAASLAGNSGLPQGHGGRINVQSDLTVEGYPQLFVLGDLANINGPDGKPLPQLASVAQQSGRSAANNIAADLEGRSRKPFQYHDKGIMAMIGKNAAVAEVGASRHHLEGTIAFAAWLGVHVALLYTFREKVEALVDWAWDYFANRRSEQVLDRKQAAHFDQKSDKQGD